MKVEVRVIQLHTPRWLKPVIVYAGVPLTTLLSFSVAVYAATVVVPNVFVDGNTLTAAAVNANFTVLKNAIDNLAAVPTSPYTDCPVGYKRNSAAGAIPVLCKKGVDEIVKVGTGSSAFWIDRYEASMWSSSLGSAGSFPTQYGIEPISSLAYPEQFAINGEVTLAIYAVSEVNKAPASYANWFQADLGCRLNGKRLPTSEEWFAAASGTVDPGENDGTSGACSTRPAAGTASNIRNTGLGATGCVSTWGAQDMIGNIAEWTADWGTGLGRDTLTMSAVWPSFFNSDGTWNVTSSVAAAGSVGSAGGLPGATIRGGAANDGFRAGVFTVALNRGPSAQTSSVGFRCAMSRQF